MKKQHLLYLHLSVFLFGFSALFARFIEMNSLMITFARVLFSGSFIGLLLLIKRENIKIDSRKHLLLLIAHGFVLTAHWNAFIFSIQVSTVAIGTITLATFPAFIAIIEPIVFKEKFRIINLGYAGLSLLGVGIIGFNLGGENRNYLLGIVFGLIASITCSMLVLINRYFSRKYPAPVILFYQQGTAVFIMLPFLLIRPPALEVNQVGLLVIYGIVFTAVAQILFIKGLERVKGVTAGLISGLEPVYAILFSLLLLSEVPRIHEIIGGIIIIFVASLVTITQNKS